jgi:hypothetical protein
MNPITNWKTTILGAVFAALVATQTFTAAGGDLTDWKQWLIPVLIAGIGALMPDPKSGNGGMKLPLILLCFFCLCSCETMTPDRTRALADVGVAILESRGYIAPKDADDIRLLGNAVIPLKGPTALPSK